MQTNLCSWACIASVFTCLNLSLALTASFAGCLLTSVPYCLLFCCLKNLRAFLRKNNCSEEVNGGASIIGCTDMSCAEK